MLALAPGTAQSITMLLIYILLFVAPSNQSAGYQRKPYLSHSTYSLVKLRRAVSKFVPAACKLAEQHFISLHFQHWRAHTSTRECACNQPCSCRIDRTTQCPLLVSARIRSMPVFAKHVKSSLVDSIRGISEADKAAFLQNKADSVSRVHTHLRAREAWKALKVLLAFSGKKSKFAKALQCLTDEQGISHTDPISIDDAKLTYYGNIELADFVSTDQVVASGNASRTAPPPILDIRSVPNASQVSAHFHSLKRGRAPGVDGVINDVYLASPDDFARIYGPLYAKMALRVREPLAFKAGIISTFLKKANAPIDAIKSQRNVLLGVNASKNYHKLTRKRIDPSLASYAHSTQCGGIDSRGTDFASHIVRLFFLWAKQPVHKVEPCFTPRPLSAPAIFSDLSDVFLYHDSAACSRYARHYRSC